MRSNPILCRNTSPTSSTLCGNRWARKATRDINADPSKDKSTFSLNASNSDARLFLLQHLDTVESFCRKQQSSLPSTSLNALHYAELIHEIGMIRKKYDKAE